MFLNNFFTAVETKPLHGVLTNAMQSHTKCYNLVDITISYERISPF